MRNRWKVERTVPSALALYSHIKIRSVLGTARSTSLLDTYCL